MNLWNIWNKRHSYKACSMHFSVCKTIRSSCSVSPRGRHALPPLSRTRFPSLARRRYLIPLPRLIAAPSVPRTTKKEKSDWTLSIGAAPRRVHLTSSGRPSVNAQRPPFTAVRKTRGMPLTRERAGRPAASATFLHFEFTALQKVSLDAPRSCELHLSSLG